MMELVKVALVAITFIGFTACTYPLTMHSRDGDSLVGRWRFAREGTGLIKVVAADGEVLVGAFQPVPRRAFFENYQNTFGDGSIDADAPDLFSYGNVFGGLLRSSSALADIAYGENYNRSAGGSFQPVRGPLLYWTANLQGDKSTTMRCFLIGSSSTGRGLGRCKVRTGKEYTFEF
jgi:hypothetical protein